jgi:hypothetical protein
MEDFLVDHEWKNLIASKGWPSEEAWRKRDFFRHGISWHIPTQSLVDLLIRLSPIVSVGSGFGYTESLVKANGGDIIATDINPDITNKWCRDGNFYTEIEKLDASEAISKYQDRNVFMAWPPYESPMAYDVAKRMEGERFLVFVGEGHGGCTGDEKFFEYLEKNFEPVKSDAIIPSWYGIHDNVYVYKKNQYERG